jgi:transposase-like protein
MQVDHLTIYRWMQHFTPLFLDAARAGTPPATGGSSTKPM